MTQATVSIRELKSRLSRYLRLTRKGETVVITDRGVPVARIIPVGLELDERVAAMCAAGLANWNGKKLRRRKPVTAAAAKKSVAQVLVDDRG